MRILAERRSLIARLIALACFLVLLIVPAPDGMTIAEWIPIRRALAIFVLCFVLWVTAALPLMVTSLLPLILFPMLDVLSVREAYSLFGNEVVFFLLGVFVLGSLVMRSGLSTRLAWTMLRLAGRSPRRLMAAALLLPAIGSFWMSEHAVVAMMFPVILEVANVLRVHDRHRAYGRALFLALAWGSIIGGVATFLGGGRAPLAVSILKQTTDTQIGFLSWMFATLPLVVAMLLVGYGLLRWLTKGERLDMRPIQELLQARRHTLGPMTARERAAAVLMVVTVIAWMGFSEHLGGLAGVALLSSVAAFAFGMIEWHEVEEDVNWGVLLMYGGAVTLGFAMVSSGAARWVSSVFFARWAGSPWLFIALISLVSIGLTEGMSNAAVVALLLPIALNFAGNDPLLAQMVTISVAVPAGLAFCLPMATPAIALAFSSGLLSVRDTVLTGLALAFVAWVLFNLVAWFWLPLIGMGRPLVTF